MKLGNYNFFCPNCDHQLDNSGKIHLKSKRDNGESGDMYLSTTFGAYSYEHVPPVSFPKNEIVLFLCPNCETHLVSKSYPDYTELIMRVEEKFDFEILFSRKAGIHKTYIITEDGVEKYGEDASNDL